jgi:hypothetical protein
MQVDIEGAPKVRRASAPSNHMRRLYSLYPLRPEGQIHQPFHRCKLHHRRRARGIVIRLGKHYAIAHADMIVMRRQQYGAERKDYF